MYGVAASGTIPDRMGEMAAKYVNMSEAAAIFGVHRTTIARWVSEERIGHRKIGSRVLIPVAALDPERGGLTGSRLVVSRVALKGGLPL